MRDEERTGSAGGGKAALRERTLLGTGSPAYAKRPPLAPTTSPVASRERTVLGVAPPSGVTRSTRAPAREVSQQPPSEEGWDLPEPVPREPSIREPSILVDLSEMAASRAPSALEAHAAEPSLVPAGVPRRGRWVWTLLLVVVAGAVAIGYERRSALQPMAGTWARWLLETRPIAALRASPIWSHRR